MLSRFSLLTALLVLVGCDATSFGSGTERVSSQSAEFLGLGEDRFGSFSAIFAYTGSVPDAGCYEVNGFTASTGTPGSATRNQVTFRDVRARGFNDSCASPTTEVVIDSLALSFPSRPPATYRFLFERIGGDPLRVTVRVAADSTVVTG